MLTSLIFDQSASYMEWLKKLFFVIYSIKWRVWAFDCLMSLCAFRNWAFLFFFYICRLNDRLIVEIIRSLITGKKISGSLIFFFSFPILCCHRNAARSLAHSFSICTAVLLASYRAISENTWESWTSAVKITNISLYSLWTSCKKWYITQSLLFLLSTIFSYFVSTHWVLGFTSVFLSL